MEEAGSPGEAAGSPQEEREDAFEDKEVYEEEKEPFIVHMDEAWRLERVLVIPRCDELGAYKSMEKQSEKLTESRERGLEGLGGLITFGVVKPYGISTSLMAANRIMASGRNLMSQELDKVHLISTNTFGCPVVFFIPADQAIDKITGELLACMEAYNRELDPDLFSLVKMGFDVDAVKIDPNLYKKQVCIGLSFMKISDMVDAIKAMDNGDYGRRKYLQVVEVADRPVKIQIRVGASIVATAQINTAIQRFSLFIGGYAPDEYTDGTVLAPFNLLLGPVCIAGSPYFIKEMPGILRVTVECDMIHAAEVKEKIDRMTEVSSSGAAILVKEAGGWSRTVSMAFGEDAALHAYTVVHKKFAKNSTGGGANNADILALKELLEANNEEIAVMRGKFEQTNECLEDIAEAQMGLDQKLNGQSASILKVDLKIEEQNLGLQSAFNRTDAKLESLNMQNRALRLDGRQLTDAINNMGSQIAHGMQLTLRSVGKEVDLSGLLSHVPSPSAISPSKSGAPGSSSQGISEDILDDSVHDEGYEPLEVIPSCVTSHEPSRIDHTHFSPSRVPWSLLIIIAFLTGVTSLLNPTGCRESRTSLWSCQRVE
jgi:hypothetical protein